MSRETLKQLHDDIEQAQAVDEQQAAHMAELRGHLQRGLDDPDHHPTLIEALERSAVLFEVDHPGLAAAIRSAVNTLSNSGV